MLETNYKDKDKDDDRHWQTGFVVWWNDELVGWKEFSEYLPEIAEIEKILTPEALDKIHPVIEEYARRRVAARYSNLYSTVMWQQRWIKRLEKKLELHGIPLPREISRSAVWKLYWRVFSGILLRHEDCGNRMDWISDLNTLPYRHRVFADNFNAFYKMRVLRYPLVRRVHSWLVGYRVRAWRRAYIKTRQAWEKRYGKRKYPDSRRNFLT
jgi:hypothetical protein